MLIRLLAMLTRLLAVLARLPLTALSIYSRTTIRTSSSLAYNLNSQPSPFVEQTLGDEPLHNLPHLPF